MTRIISGEWRGHSLPKLSGGTVRPTTDRARTILFDTLRDVRDMTVLDLYSGTGALGFEALSRGAVSLVSVDRDRGYIQEQKAWISTHPKPFTAYVGEVERVLYRLQASFDLILADPPYQEGLSKKTLEWIESHIAPDGTFVLEKSKRDEEVISSPVLILEKEKVVAETRIQIYKATEK